VLVVVNVMARVAVVPVDVVDVVLVSDSGVAAAILVHVHVPRVGDMRFGAREHAVQVVHVVFVNVVDVAVVQEVHVVLVRHRGVAAEAVVHVGMLLQRLVGNGVGHRFLRRSR
jgi:hypothetical protein